MYFINDHWRHQLEGRSAPGVQTVLSLEDVALPVSSGSDIGPVQEYRRLRKKIPLI